MRHVAPDERELRERLKFLDDALAPLVGASPLRGQCEVDRFNGAA